MKNYTLLWREARLEVKKLKAPHVRSTFGSSDVEQTHAVAVRSICPSQNVQGTSVLEHFWKLRCRKSACRCGAKHMSKSKCTRHFSVGPFSKLRCSKSARCWGAKHISKSKKDETPHVCATFGHSDVVACGRRKGFCT